MTSANELTQHANDLLEYYYPDWLNIFSIYEKTYKIYNEGDFQIYDLYVYYEKNGQKFVDFWNWKYSSVNNPIGYIETNYVIKYNYENFLSNEYFSNFIIPHLI